MPSARKKEGQFSYNTWKEETVDLYLQSTAGMLLLEFSWDKLSENWSITLVTMKNLPVTAGVAHYC
jgi:hypothetical protein